MKLYAQVTSERASKGQGGNEFILIDFNVEREPIGQVELYIFNDIKEHKCTTNEWLLKYRPSEEDDWQIIAQGNHIPELKGKRQKDECECGNKTSNNHKMCDKCLRYYSPLK